MPTPTTISERYEVLERLDQGESGEVLKVRHRTLRSLSVLKVVSDESLSDPEAEAGFYRQANAAAVLHHPNIIRVLDVDRDEDLRIRYVVMEYIDGQTLDERLRDRGVLSLGETLDLCRQVGGAVAYAHRESESVTFRGITASNIFVEEGTNRFVVTGVGAADQTAAGSEGGSTGDLVSLGFLAYYAHTGALPPTGHDAPAPRELPFPQATPGPFRELVRKTLEGGYRTAEDFLGDVAAIHAPPTKPPEPPEPAHRPAREVDPPTAAQAPIPQAEPAPPKPGPVPPTRASRAAAPIAIALVGVLLASVAYYGFRAVEDERPPASDVTAGADPAHPAEGVVAAPTDLAESPASSAEAAAEAEGAVESEATSPVVERVTAAATLDLEFEAEGATEATLDGRRVKLPATGPIPVELTKLPVGESHHQLAVVGTDGVADTIEIVVTHYPGWQIQEIDEVGGEVYSLGFSPDQRTAVSGSRDNLLRLWDLKTRELLNIFVGHDDWVDDLALSSDGTLILSGSKDGTLRLWDTQSGDQIRSFEGHLGWVNSVDLSPDGTRAISGGEDRTIRLWDTQTGKETLRIEAPEPVYAVRFSPDGQTALAAGSDQVLRLLDVRSGVVLQELLGHEDWITTVAFSPDGTMAVSGSDDTTARLWDLRTGEEIHTLSGHKGWVMAVAISPDGTTIATASKDGTARLWSAETGELTRTFEGHKGMVTEVEFSADGRQLLSAGRDATLRLWWAGDTARANDHQLPTTPR